MTDIERPFVFINVAASADGKISTVERRQVRISSKEDFERVDELRANSDAIMVGVGTILSDNPSLTVKSEERRKRRRERGEEENPLRIVVDSRARTPTDAEVLNKGEGKRMIVVSEKAKVEDIGRLGGKAEILVCGSDEVDLKKLLYLLRQRGIERLMVEGGATLNWSLISQRLVDELYVYIGNMIIGGKDAPTIIDGSGFIKEEDMVRLEIVSVDKMGEGVLLRWRVREV
ncbi:MAG: 2,5-diamino-6-(ribosylamino)-4(3H)-pyrimidinone 5'-phosphate reductase [Candidatus Methanospirareceae archaeon]